MNPRVKAVIPTDDYKLILTFKNEEEAILKGYNIFNSFKFIIKGQK